MRGQEREERRILPLTGFNISPSLFVLILKLFVHKEVMPTDFAERFWCRLNPIVFKNKYRLNISGPTPNPNPTAETPEVV